MKKIYLKNFFITFVITLAFLLLDIIQNNGMFIYSADYAYQQIPFTYHVTDYLHSGNIGWDWYTDLGADFVGAYSFYLLGSVFYWIISFVSANKVIYLIPVMLAVKTAIASVTSMIYIKRYVKDERCAFIGSLLYAFSGFQMFNIVFNHFHDVTAIFPLLMLSFDMLVKENKKCFFSLMVAVSAFTNYFFFVGEVIFIVIYYTIKCIKKEFEFNIKSFMCITVESVVGVLCASVILIPSFFAVNSGERATDFLFGTDLISYKDNTIIPKIIQSIFIMPDLPANAQLFQSDYNTNNWASISLYIPLFASVGVFTFIKNNKKSFISVFLLCCSGIALIPVLNSMFYFFNSSYYARWFYMPVLFMCIATVKTLEEGYDLKSGIKFQSAGIIVLSLIAVLPNEVEKSDISTILDVNNVEKTIQWFGMSSIPAVFWQSITFGGISLLILYIYNEKKNSDSIVKKFVCIILAFILVTGSIYIKNSKDNLEIQNYREKVTDYTPELSEENFYRINLLHKNAINANMVWNKSSISQFHSIVPGSIETLYSKLKAEDRGMFSDYTEKDYPVYGLLSVKYAFNESTGDDLNVQIKQVEIPGFKLFDKQGCFYIYENEYFVNMGFPYDYCISDDELKDYINTLGYSDAKQKSLYRQLALMRVMVLGKEDIEIYKDVIQKIPPELLVNLDENTYFADCKDRAENTCYNFEYNHKGFKAKFYTPESKLLFFSVPAAKGWTAYVNGKETEIITAQYGLSAVCTDTGENLIEFKYETPGLRTGIILTVISFSVLFLYTVIYFLIKRRGRYE